MHLAHVGVKLLDVLGIEENESLLWVEPESDDVLYVADSHLCNLLLSKLRSVHELLIISDLDDKWHIECLLHVLGHDEWDGVSEVESLSRWSSSGIEVEELASLISIEDDVEISVAEKDITPDEAMGRFSSETLDFFSKLVGHARATEYVNKFVIVDTFFADGSDVERGNNVFWLA